MSAMKPHDIADQAVALGGDGTLAIVSVESQADVRWANSMLTTNGERTTTTLTVVSTAPVAGGTAVGSATGPVRSDVDLQTLVQQAKASAREGEAASDAAPLITGGSPADWTDDVATTSGAAFAEFALNLGHVFGNGRAQAVEHFGYAEHDVTTTFLASSTGLRRRHTQPTARVEATGKSHNRTRSSWAGRAGQHPDSFDLQAIEAELSQGLHWQGRQIDLEPGRHDTILSPSAISDLLIYMHWTSSARDAADGRSVFSKANGKTRVGESLTEAPLTLSSDPHHGQLACDPFVHAAYSSSFSSPFDAGLELSATNWILDGQLEHLITTRQTAQETSAAVTPPIDNLTLTHGQGSGQVADLISRSDHCLLVTCLWYIRDVDPRTLLLTGLTRDGVYLIEKGEVVGSVGNFRFNASPVDVLASITDASETVVTLPREWADYFTRASMPAVAVEGFNLSTRSDAL
jgi:predicted Zn-dependent protease